MKLHVAFFVLICFNPLNGSDLNESMFTIAERKFVKYGDEILYKMEDGQSSSALCPCFEEPTKVACVLRKLTPREKFPNSWKITALKIILLRRDTNGKWLLQHLNIGTSNPLDIVVVFNQPEPVLMVSMSDRPPGSKYCLLKWRALNEAPTVIELSQASIAECLKCSYK